jgi:hypothetical protein
MLIDLIDQWKPAPGDLIVIDYLGSFPVSSDPSRSFRKFDMAVGYDTSYEDSAEAFKETEERFVRKNQEYENPQRTPEPPKQAGAGYAPDQSPFLSRLPNYRLGMFSHMSREDAVWVCGTTS